jgi:hypothetical protein
MNSCLQDTIGGFNAFVDSQKEFGGTLTLCTFDHEFEMVYEKVPIDKVPPLDFVPRGLTALYDAMGKVLKMSLTDDAMVIVLTDGVENASKTYTAAHIKDLVEMKPWKFVYLGANQDVFLNSANIGIRTSLSYDSPKDAFQTLTALSTQYSQGLKF